MSIKSKATLKTMKQLQKISGAELSLGGLINAIRLCDEHTLDMFSKKLQISKSHLCDIEKGRKPVSAKLAAQYADILGYSREQFIRLALQDQLNRAGLKFEVDINKAA